jgi:hypothetical protein
MTAEAVRRLLLAGRARLARGREAAKLRFVATVTVGLGSALMLALGAGILAGLRAEGRQR